ncbi:hypothetical protein JCM18909_3074 [Cutibacterium acnes JCM 18909]|nr:hypothetical protein JCM18909_3074 [Cutibacterium acnes JCM 18909]
MMTLAGGHSDGLGNDADTEYGPGPQPITVTTVRKIDRHQGLAILLGATRW